jgi:hypothetical protein
MEAPVQAGDAHAYGSLLATGSVLGLAMPIGVPVWILLIVLFVAYGILTGPLKYARHSYYYGGGWSKAAWPSICFLDTVIGIAVALVLLWLVVHYMPELRDAIRHIPGVVHEAAEDIRSWWHGH